VNGVYNTHTVPLANVCHALYLHNGTSDKNVIKNEKIVQGSYGPNMVRRDWACPKEHIKGKGKVVPMLN